MAERPSILGSAVMTGGAQIEEALHPRDEGPRVVGIERVVERQHRHGMAHLAELLRRRGAHAHGRAVFADEVGKRASIADIAVAELVVFGVGQLRRVFARNRACRGARSRRPAALAQRRLLSRQFNRRVFRVTAVATLAKNRRLRTPRRRCGGASRGAALLRRRRARRPRRSSARSVRWYH